MKKTTFYSFAMAFICGCVHPVFAGNVLSTDPQLLYQSNQDYSGFGKSVAPAGDLNGDGFQDLVVGALFYDDGLSNEGAAMVYYGTAAGLPETPSIILQCDQVFANMGSSVASAGDINNDGFDDLLVGCMYYDNGQMDEGAVFVYYGSATGVSATWNAILECNQAFASIGYSVSSAGDVNNDGYDDVVAGAPYYSNGSPYEGRAYFFFGGPTGISTTPFTTKESNQTFGNMGAAVACAGDVNNDGYDDVIVSSLQYSLGLTNEGAVFVYHGNATGVSTLAVTTIHSNQTGAFMGISIAGAGDVNNDGFDDVIVGNNTYDTPLLDAGRATVYLGSTLGVSSTPVATINGIQTEEFLGGGVASAGDINNDGFDDVIVGAYGYDGWKLDEGVGFVFPGTATGIGLIPIDTIQSFNEAGAMGRSFAGNVDFNNDGLLDVAAGVFNYTDPEWGEGAVFIYYSFVCDNIYYADADGDGYGNAAITVLGCIPPAGYVTNTLDCNDANAAIHPGVPEICNAIDENCNGLTDEGATETVSITAAGATGFCPGGSVLLSATYTGTAVQWRKLGVPIAGATNDTYLATVKGYYSCTSTGICGMGVSNEILVDVYKNPPANITAGGPVTFCPGGFVVLTANTGPYTYQWWRGATILPGETNISYTATSSGNYKCRVTSAVTGCSKQSNNIYVTVDCKVGGEEANTISLFPVPAKNEVVLVTGNNQEKDIALFAADGALLQSWHTADRELHIDTHTYAAGVYFITVNSGGEEKQVQCVIE